MSELCSTCGQTTPLGRRWKRMLVSADLLLSLFESGTRHYTIAQGVPKDAVLLDVRHSRFTDTVELLLESPEFPELEDGEQIPYLDPLFHVKLRKAD